ncbi:MAG: putative porin, partial [Paludibacteraceae bacterium]|nr:putative porin [Paludibacteraceae bacterium]
PTAPAPTATASKDSVTLSYGEALKAWHVQEPSAIEVPSSPDTLHLNYQRATTPVYNKYIAAEWLGNMGLPAQSAVLSDRQGTKLTGDFLFQHSYEPYYLGVEDVYFYNTRVPYTNIAYYTGGYTRHGEDRLNGLFSANVNKRLNLGLCFDYIYGRGSFYNQSSDGLNGALNLSYRGERYSAYFIAGINNMRNYENGGIASDASLRGMDDSYNVPVAFGNANVFSTFRSYYFWTDHQYHIGYKQLDPDDSEKSTFIPVATLSYTIKYEGSRKRYYEKSVPLNFYDKNFYSDSYSRDTVSLNYIRNVLSITFNEGFKPWMVFSLRAFAEADWEENMRMTGDSQYTWNAQAKVSVGGELFKRTGNTTYGVLGEVLLLGSDKRPAFNVNGDFNTVIPLKTCSLTINAVGHIKSVNPSYFQEHYYSNHFIWENKFNNTWDARGYGKIGIPNKWVDFEVGAGWQGLKQYIYFDSAAMPAQCNDFIQIISGEAKLNLKVKWFHWENKAVLQYTSKPEVMSLPLVSVYSNLYAAFRVFKVLNIQLGVDCRYNTKYYANAYMPATGQFYVQNKVLCGNYPEMNLYANFKLKKFRFFVMWYNFSSLFMEPTYMTTPHYPLNPSMVKIGLSWNFYD